MTLELYNFSQSTCSLKVRIALEEKGLPWVDKRLVSKDHDHLSDWYLKLNPNGVVPTLLHDGRPVIESSVIMQYIDQIAPEPPLMPADPYDQATVRAWLVYVDLVTTPASRFPSFQYGGLRIKFQALSQEEFDEKTNKRPVKSGFYKKMSKQDGFPPDVMDAAFRDLRATVERMEAMLAASGGPWLMGKQFTIADIAVAPLIDRNEDIGFEVLWEDGCPRVTEWLAAVQARPAFQRAYYHGCRLSEIYPELKLGRGAHRHVLDPNASVPA